MEYSADLIGKTIRSEREKRNWTQKKLGDKLNVSGKQVSKYEHGEPIPPIDVMLKLCELFECELGFLLGESSYSEGTKLQTAILDSLKLEISSTEAIKRITGTSRSDLSFGYESQKYIRILNNLLSSPVFQELIEAIGHLDDYISQKESLFDPIEKKYGKEIFNQAFQLYFDSSDLYTLTHPSDICDCIKDIDQAVNHGDNLGFAIKVERYEIRESFEELITDLYPRD